MDKQSALESIEKATESHLHQMDKIRSLIAGKDIENPTAVSQTQCAFGKWLYGDDNHVQEILGVQFYENLETLHSSWHIQYFKIYNIFFKREDEHKGLLTKFFGGGNKVSEMEIDKAKLYYAELKEVTDKLLKALAASKRRILALSDSKFE